MTTEAKMYERMQAALQSAEILEASANFHSPTTLHFQEVKRCARLIRTEAEKYGHQLEELARTREDTPRNVTQESEPYVPTDG